MKKIREKGKPNLSPTAFVCNDAQPPQVRTMTVPFPYSLPKGPHHVEPCVVCSGTTFPLNPTLKTHQQITNYSLHIKRHLFHGYPETSSPPCSQYPSLPIPCSLPCYIHHSLSHLCLLHAFTEKASIISLSHPPSLFRTLYSCICPMLILPLSGFCKQHYSLNLINLNPFFS